MIGKLNMLKSIVSVSQRSYDRLNRTLPRRPQSQIFLANFDKHIFIYMISKKNWLKGALAKIFVKKRLRLKVEERLWFVIKYIILKQTPLNLKTFPLKCILNQVSIYIYLQANIMFIEWMSENSSFIVICWTLIIGFQTKNTPKTRLNCLFFVHVSFGEERKRREYS